MIDVFMVLTTPTLDKIMKLEKAEYAMLLYLFYYKCAKQQQTNQPWATVGFCSKGLGWGERQIRFARNNLKSLGLIEDVRLGIGSKTYTKLNFITAEDTLSSIFKGPHDPCTFSKGHKSATQNALNIKSKKCLKKKSSKDDLSDPKGTHRRKKPKIVIVKNKNVDPQNSSKFTLTVTDFRNYNEIKSNGATNHRKDSKAEFDSLDKLHSLFSNRCKNPYHVVHVPEQYIDFKWDMDELIDTFKFQLLNAKSYNVNPVKSIGKFILSEGYNGSKSWSPLLYWHQKKNKSANGEMTDDGKKLLSSMKRAKINNIENLESSIINKVGKELFNISSKYELIDGSNRSMTYPFGIVDCLSKYIKEKTNKLNFKLVYITKNGFVNEFLETAVQRNVIKKKIGGRRAN